MMPFHIAYRGESVSCRGNRAVFAIRTDDSFRIADDAVIVSGNPPCIISGIQCSKTRICSSCFHRAVTSVDVAGIISCNTAGIGMYRNDDTFINPVIDLNMQISLRIRQKQTGKLFRIFCTSHTDIMIFRVFISHAGIATGDASRIFVSNDMVRIFTLFGGTAAYNTAGGADVESHDTAHITISEKITLPAFL